ncbi:5-demethoxyubiquinone hydroxylase mitochondrial [Lipomyces arxii]|uniref:5-demethoxyubiquinone hydroxylase mitochondrial n=1 Tax=Lipomyces arxii TaxID=56418 RepID=UPI0034CEC242
MPCLRILSRRTVPTQLQSRVVQFTSCRLNSTDTSSKDDSSDLASPRNNAEEYKPLPPFSPETKSLLSRIIRVDQAGELGADLIYSGQHVVFKRTRPDLAPLIQHMWDQEIHHHKTFNELQVNHRVRPSLLSPVWKVAAYGLGVGTALMGKEAAMACTLAVETVIGGHYNHQLRDLVDLLERDAALSPYRSSSAELQELCKTITKFRNDELEHLDTAIENDAHQARPYRLLTETIKGGCRAAVWVAEKI